LGGAVEAGAVGVVLLDQRRSGRVDGGSGNDELQASV
jgi:hypothetical protein